MIRMLSNISKNSNMLKWILEDQQTGKVVQKSNLLGDLNDNPFLFGNKGTANGKIVSLQKFSYIARRDQSYINLKALPVMIDIVIIPEDSARVI